MFELLTRCKESMTLTTNLPISCTFGKWGTYFTLAITLLCVFYPARQVYAVFATPAEIEGMLENNVGQLDNAIMATAAAIPDAEGVLLRRNGFTQFTNFLRTHSLDEWCRYPHHFTRNLQNLTDPVVARANVDLQTAVTELPTWSEPLYSGGSVLHPPGVPMGPNMMTDDYMFSLSPRTFWVSPRAAVKETLADVINPIPGRVPVVFTVRNPRFGVPVGFFRENVAPAVPVMRASGESLYGAASHFKVGNITVMTPNIGGQQQEVWHIELVDENNIPLGSRITNFDGEEIAEREPDDVPTELFVSQPHYQPIPVYCARPGE
ncbi:MAG: hypothetical protein KZQ89_21235 [Candidatus Thiodiazotropha sp. (ex Lucinoma kastoroae)]|nr:hypothetical protein [Candidatus Thiodiazotropha sp. (ex Lucinoma kastoroae)]MCU7858924.1 hypothetical protein [Candidatus Thiodiazotropha sp. (ex Lucinoma kastoroae)]